MSLSKALAVGTIGFIIGFFAVYNAEQEKSLELFNNLKIYLSDDEKSRFFSLYDRKEYKEAKEFLERCKRNIYRRTKPHEQ